MIGVYPLGVAPLGVALRRVDGEVSRNPFHLVVLSRVDRTDRRVAMKVATTSRVTLIKP